MNNEKDLFIVSRASSYGDDPPCDNAFQLEVINVDVRNTDDPKKIPANRGTDGNWYVLGTNHRVVNGKITRELGTRKEWVVSIKNILEFVDKYGACVIGKTNNGDYTITIYDDYIE